jgi:DNA helicase-4
VAGAGAGKTTTMAAKVKYLVDKQHVSPEDIIVISYTNKAINELKERINAKQIWQKGAKYYFLSSCLITRFASLKNRIAFSLFLSFLMLLT